MVDLRLETVEVDREDVAQRILEGLDAVPLPEGVAPYRTTPLVIALRDEDGTIQGGLVGESLWGWLYVNYLWVAEERQSQGCGSRLMAEAEAEAIRRDCIGVWLKTHSFQAPTFYERLGYSAFGQLDDFPEGHQQILYKKHLRSFSKKEQV